MKFETTSEDPGAPAIFLEDVPWEVYTGLRDIEANNHVGMTYHDGDLILMTAEHVYYQSEQRIGLLVRMVAVALGIDVAGIGTTTLLRSGSGNQKGSGKEPDIGFYVGHNEELIRKKSEIDLDVDPPPDLAIDVDDTGDAEIALPAYAAIGVPEVWRYDARGPSIWFGRLVGESYESIGRSVCLPVLTPELVLHALSVVESGQMSETRWISWINDWTRGFVVPETD